MSYLSLYKKSISIDCIRIRIIIIMDRKTNTNDTATVNVNANLYESVRRLQIIRSLWFRILGHGHVGASRNDLSGFLDVLEWRVNDEINEIEFTTLVAQWIKQGHKYTNRHLNNPHNHSGGTKSPISEQHFREILNDRGYSITDLDLFFSLLINENNKSLLATFASDNGSGILVNNNSSYSNNSKHSVIETNNFQVTPEWLAAVETLFFSLDTHGYGTLSFPQIEMLNFALMTWHVQYAGQTIDNYDEFAENVRQRAFDMLRDMGGTVEHVYRYVGIVGLDAFKHFLILRRAKVENLNATLAVIRSFSVIWGDIRTLHVKEQYKLFLRKVEMGTKNIPRPFEISVLNSPTGRTSKENNNDNDNSNNNNDDHLEGPSLDIYLLVDAAPAVWRTMIRTVAASRQQGIFNSSNGATSITRDGWAKVAGDIWHDFTKLDGVDTPSSLESLLQDGRAHKILAVLSSYQNLQREIIGLFLKQYVHGNYALSNNFTSSNNNVYVDMEDDMNNSNMGGGGGDNSVLPLVFPIVQSRNILDRMKNNNNEPMLALNDNSYYDIDPFNSMANDTDIGTVVAENGSYYDETPANRMQNNNNKSNNVNKDNRWQEVTYDTLFTDEYLNDLKHGDNNSKSLKSKPPFVGSTRRNTHVLTEKVQLVEKVVKEYEMVLSELEEPVKQEVGREDRNFQIDESKQTLKMAKSSPLIKISNDKKTKTRTPEKNDMVETHKLSPVLLRDVEKLLTKVNAVRSRSNSYNDNSNGIAFDSISNSSNNKNAYYSTVKEQMQQQWEVNDDREIVTETLLFDDSSNNRGEINNNSNDDNNTSMKKANNYPRWKNISGNLPKKHKTWQSPPRVSVMLRALPNVDRNGGRILQEGKLMKKGSGKTAIVGRRNWKQRIFKLTLFLPNVKVDDVLPHPYATLEYSDEDGKLLGTVVIDAYSTIEAFVQKSSKYDFCFGIRRVDGAVDLFSKNIKKYAVEGHVRDSIDLRAISREEQLEWEKAFKKAVASCQLIEDLRASDLIDSQRQQEEQMRNVTVDSMNLMGKYGSPSNTNNGRANLVGTNVEGPSKEAKRRYSIGLKRGLSAFFAKKKKKNVDLRKVNTAPANTLDNLNVQIKVDAKPKENPKLVASLLAEIDDHLNDDDGNDYNNSGLKSPFQGEGEGLDGLGANDAKRAKVLREALRSMNPKEPSLATQQLKLSSSFSRRQQQRYNYDKQKNAINNRLTLHESHTSIGRNGHYDGGEDDDSHGTQRFLSTRFAAPVRPKMVFGRRVEENPVDIQSMSKNKKNKHTTRMERGDVMDDDDNVESALRDHALNNAGGVVDVDEMMRIQRMRHQQPEKRANNYSAMKAKNRSAINSNGKTGNKNTINGVAKVAHHEERAMPEKVTLASQRNLNDIPHRSEGLKSPPKQVRQEFI